MTEYERMAKLLKRMARISLENAIYSGPGYADAAFQDKMGLEMLKALEDNGAEIKFRTAEKNNR